MSDEEQKCLRKPYRKNAITIRSFYVKVKTVVKDPTESEVQSLRENKRFPREKTDPRYWNCGELLPYASLSENASATTAKNREG